MPQPGDAANHMVRYVSTARHFASYWASVHLVPASREAGTASTPPSDPEHIAPDDQGLCLYPLMSCRVLDQNCLRRFDSRHCP